MQEIEGNLLTLQQRLKIPLLGVVPLSESDPPAKSGRTTPAARV